MAPVDCRGMTLQACLRVQSAVRNACPKPQRDYSVAPAFIYTYARPWSSTITHETFGVTPWKQSTSKSF